MNLYYVKKRAEVKSTFIQRKEVVFNCVGGMCDLSKMDIDTVTTAPQNHGIANPSGKHWAGCTLNNYTAADEACFLAKLAPICDYYVYGKEVGEQGTPHLQFMVCFKKQTRLSAVRKIFPSEARWFVKSPKSTMVQASDYCKKVCFILSFSYYLFCRMILIFRMVTM